MVELLYLAIPLTVVIVIGVLMSLRESRPPSIDGGIDSFSQTQAVLGKRLHRGTHVDVDR
ncbi:MAG: hypothetical protein ACYDHP_03985 [Ferrimicrobium sp.]